MLYFSNHKIFLDISFPMEALNVILVGDACPYIAKDYLKQYNPNIILCKDTEELLEKKYLDNCNSYSVVFTQKELWKFLFNWIKIISVLSDEECYNWVYEYLTFLKQAKMINTEDFFIEYPSRDIDLESKLYKQLEILTPSIEDLKTNYNFGEHIPVEFSIAVYNLIHYNIEDYNLMKHIDKCKNIWNSYNNLINNSILKELPIYDVPKPFNNFHSLSDIYYLGFMFDNNKFMTNIPFLIRTIKNAK